MNYAKAQFRMETMSVVYWHGHHWRIEGLNRLKQTADMIMDDGDEIVLKSDVPLKEISE